MLSIAKSGLVTTLQTRASVFGAMRPCRAFSPHESLAAATGLSESLLSRFDIVLLLLDETCPDWDEPVVDHILHNHQTRLKPHLLQVRPCSLP